MPPIALPLVGVTAGALDADAGASFPDTPRGSGAPIAYLAQLRTTMAATASARLGRRWPLSGRRGARGAGGSFSFEGGLRMPPRTDDFTIGIEEEYQIIDPETRALRPRAEQVVPAAQRALGEDKVQHEFKLTQVETISPVCHTLADVRAEVVRLRREVIAAAAEDGNRIAAAGTHPFARVEEQRTTPKKHYEEMAKLYTELGRELLIFGCHIHVGLADPAAGIGVLNRARPWLAPLLALTANSPFWEGTDTGYASYRTEVWGRWPLAGPPLPLTSRDEYDALVRSLVATGAIQDASQIYWDLRLPEKTETVEFRVGDVSAMIDEVVMQAGLCRALARTCTEQEERGEPYATVRPELLRAAHWRAARYGLEGELIDVAGQQSVPAAELIHWLLAFVRPTLEAQGDWDEVSWLVVETLERGNGATRQRAAYRRAGRLEDVVDLLVAETARGTEAPA